MNYGIPRKETVMLIPFEISTVKPITVKSYLETRKEQNKKGSTREDNCTSYQKLTLCWTAGKQDYWKSQRFQHLKNVQIFTNDTSYLWPYTASLDLHYSYKVLTSIINIESLVHLLIRFTTLMNIVQEPIYSTNRR